MKKVYIWGLGFFFKSNIQHVNEQFQIVGYIDNNRAGDSDDKYGIILSSKDITEDMTILIMSKKFVPMAKELAKCDYKKVIIGSMCFPECYQEKLLSANGSVEIDNGNVWYKYKNGMKVLLESQEDVSCIFENLVRKTGIFKSINGLPKIPVCRDFGISRGMPVDRYYIEKFLELYKTDIKGSVLEIAENTYTYKFGENRVKNSYMLHIKGWGDGVVEGNLETGEGIMENVFDTAIITQTLMFIYDVESAVKNIYKMLKPGGVALITVAGISQISRYDEDNWGSYWNFQIGSIKKLFTSCFDESKVVVEQYGNVKIATALLYGLCREEIDESDYDYNDSQYPVIIGIRAEK